MALAFVGRDWLNPQHGDPEKQPRTTNNALNKACHSSNKQQKTFFDVTPRYYIGRMPLT